MGVYMEQLSFYPNDQSFNRGAEVGFRVGISFALQEMWKFLGSEDTFDELLSKVWLAYLQNSETAIDEINRHRYEKVTTILSEFFDAEEDRNSLAYPPLHQMLNQRQKEMEAWENEERESE